MSPRRTRRRPIPADAADIRDVMDRMFPPTAAELVRQDEYGADMDIAQLVYDARAESKLTQSQLAKRIGTTQSVISRLEDWDYKGHSLRMLIRIAHALGKKVELKLVPKDEPEAAVPAKRRKR
jgi:ribosome-binding protein aMBF1 (putative translation factor)